MVAERGWPCPRCGRPVSEENGHFYHCTPATFRSDLEAPDLVLYRCRCGMIQVAEDRDVEVLSKGAGEWYSRIEVFVWQCDRCGAMVTGESYLDLDHKVRAHMERCGR